MRQKEIILGLFISVLISSSVYGQNNCKVLKVEISASYSGNCKKGLASGVGEAKGEDYYTGEFLRGYPDGKGTYIWKNGSVYKGDWKNGLREGKGEYTSKGNGRDSILNGNWHEDKFIGKSKPPMPYVIEYKNSIGRVSCAKVGDRPYVKYKFSRNGDESNNISNLLLQGSSGSESNSVSFTGYEQVTFPFIGKVKFNAPNSFMSAILSCELRLRINEPGSWVVTIFY
jgi:hypothetical protein